VKEVYPDVKKEELETRDFMERKYHTVLHGKGRPRKYAFNAQVRRWLQRAKRKGGRQNFNDFAKYIAKKRDDVYLELYKIFQRFPD